MRNYLLCGIFYLCYVLASGVEFSFEWLIFWTLFPLILISSITLFVILVVLILSLITRHNLAKWINDRVTLYKHFGSEDNNKNVIQAFKDLFNEINDINEDDK